MSLATASYLTILAPLVGCMLIALLGNRLPAARAGWLGSGAILLSFVGAVGAWSAFGDAEMATQLTPWTWLDAGAFNVGLDLYIDPLSITEMLVVSGVAFLIHVYSIGYMHGDAQERRFFAYMNLFVFAMLTLVMAGNLVLLLVGWGLVGMASYLLIGFWNDRPSATAAAKKAFVINAIGDVSLMLGLFLVFAEMGALDYPAVFAIAPEAVADGGTNITLICLLLLGGAIAKSAQLPLHTWLPDAMEGPTPVSALIHAATMVTAGVYLVARMHPLFSLSNVASTTTVIIGMVTLVVAGLIALVQTDIKRIIAYSTMSQIGYMIVAVGLGALGAGMFHLTTHAFFKALLFLGAGIVIHALLDEQDIRKMGGLKKYLPKTYVLFMIASLALAGIPPLAGFFSKDEIIASAFAGGQQGIDAAYFAWALGLVGALLTGIYAFRLMFVVFHGAEGEATKQLAAHPHKHEAPLSMMWPVGVLGVLTCIAGFFGIPGVTDTVPAYLDQAHAAPTNESIHHWIEEHMTFVWGLAGMSVAIALAGIGVAWQVWGSGAWKAMRTAMNEYEPMLQKGFYFDDAYEYAFARPYARIATVLSDHVEAEAMPHTVTAPARATSVLARWVSIAQAGLLRVYISVMFAAVAIFVVAWLVMEA